MTEERIFAECYGHVFSNDEMVRSVLSHLSAALRDRHVVASEEDFATRNPTTLASVPGSR